MKLLFNRFKSKLLLLLARFKGSFTSLLRNRSKLRKSILFSLLMLGSMTLGCYSAALASSTLKTNKTQSIAETISKNNINKDMLGFLYGYETSPDTYELCSVRPELSKELRSIKIEEKWELYDVYPRDFNGSTPGIVNYLDQISVNVSFLLIPKEYYTFSQFQYPFELICGSTSNQSNIEDIYINQKYADYLLSINGESDNYASLLDTNIEIPYKNKYLANSPVPLTYKIKGILKEESGRYQYYKNYFGDFFLANQYLSLPLSSGTCFFLKNNVNEIREQLDLIYRIYNYETSARSFDALNFAYKYDYRTVGITTLEGQNSIDTIYDNGNGYMNSLNSLYEYYFYKNYVIPFIFLLVFDIVFCLLLIWSSLQLRKLYRRSVFITAFAIINVISLFVAFFINKAPLLLQLLKVSLSTNSWQAFVTMIAQIILISTLLTIISLIKSKKSKFKKDN